MSRGHGLAACLLLAACSPPPTSAPAENSAANAPEIIASPKPTATPTPSPTAVAAAPCLPGPPATFVECEFLGRWRGVEGMYLVVTKATRAGEYRLEMQWDLDHRGLFTAASVGEPAAPGLIFTRQGKELMLHRTGGDATGLKYLAGKKDCLTVAPGEGYCRD